MNEYEWNEKVNKRNVLYKQNVKCRKKTKNTIPGATTHREAGSQSVKVRVRGGNISFLRFVS